jgi:MYXO-CTERM domain-containing protein
MTPFANSRRPRGVVVPTVLAIVGLAAAAAADVRTAATCGLDDVQAAVDGATDGDTVLIPPGTCSWAAPLRLDLESGGGRALEVLGAGIDVTLVRVEAGLAEVTGAAGKGWRLSGLTQETAYVAAEQTGISIGGASTSWRVDHLKLVAHAAPFPPLRHVAVHGRTWGLIDHCEFVGEVASAVVVDGENWATWREPQEWGTAEAVYVEDCLFRVTPRNEAVAGGTTDCQRGGRFVFRHNVVDNQIAQCHGFDSGQHASCMSMEVYGNTHSIRATTTLAWAWLGQIRGGAALWFDNTFDVEPYAFPPAEAGVWLGDAIALRVYRAEGSPYGWHPCDGTPLRLCANVAADWTLLDGSWWPLSCTTDAECTADRHHGAHDATCRWRVCSGDGMALCDPARGDADCADHGLGTCTAFLDGPGDGTPCFQQPGRSTGNALRPAYEWNNSCVGAQPSACVGGLGSGNVHYGEDVPQLRENVDYYNFKPSGFDGTAGTGRGLLADRPTHCVPAVAFFATDANTLYCCESADTWVACYTPYPYPHPLQAGGGPDVDGGTGSDAGADGGAAGGTDAGAAGGTDAGADAGQVAGESGCGCRTSEGPTGGVLALLALALGAGRRRHRAAAR